VEIVDDEGKPLTKRRGTLPKRQPSKKVEWQPSMAQLFFQSMSGVSKDAVSEFFNLAELAFVMMPGSVEEERMFSALKYLKSALRNRLSTELLTAAARIFKNTIYSVATFPYHRAVAFWHQMTSRGRRSAPMQKKA
jgi:hypothetical protein